MDRPHRLIAVATLVIAAGGLAASARSQSVRADAPIVIQGRPLGEWVAGLDDPEPAQRKWVLQVLRRAAPDPAGGPIPGLPEAVTRVMFRDRDPDVRGAAGDFLLELSRVREPAGDDRHKALPTPIRLVDLQGRPVAGAIVGAAFSKDRDQERSFRPWEAVGSRTTDARGEAALELSRGEGIYALRQDRGRAYAGVHLVALGEAGKPITIVMHPACRVRMHVEVPKLRDLAARARTELSDDYAWRTAAVHLEGDMDNDQSGMRLLTSSITGDLEFLLPPGRFQIVAFASPAPGTMEPIEIGPAQRVRNLGTIEVSGGDAVEQGLLYDCHRLSIPDPPAARDDDDAASKGRVRLRAVERKYPYPYGEAERTWGLDFSPDGKRLATAHSSDVVTDPQQGDVKIWDSQTRRLVATWPVPDEIGGVRGLAFAPDGKTLAGPVGRTDGVSPHWAVVLWDVDGRRAPRVLRGHRSWVLAVAFAPDGKTLASGGADHAVLLWDVATGREIGRIDAAATRVTTLAFSPDGQTLAIGGGASLGLWDVPGRRLRARLDAEKFMVRSVAFAPDGRMLAVAGQHAVDSRVWLHDLAVDPPALRAELSLERRGPVPPDTNNFWGPFSDVAFTPGGRRIVAVAPKAIGIWDVATALQVDFIDRRAGDADDHLALSSDGRWLAVTESRNASLIDISPAGT